MSRRQIKALVIIGIMYLFLFSLLLIPFGSQAQTKKTDRGYTIVLDGLYLSVDTIESKTFIYNRRKGKWARKVFIQINGGSEHYLPNGSVYMAWSDRFVLTVKRKGIVKSYKI